MSSDSYYSLKEFQGVDDLPSWLVVQSKRVRSRVSKRWQGTKDFDFERKYTVFKCGTLGVGFKVLVIRQRMICMYILSTRWKFRYDEKITFEKIVSEMENPLYISKRGLESGINWGRNKVREPVGKNQVISRNPVRLQIQNW